MHRLWTIVSKYRDEVLRWRCLLRSFGVDWVVAEQGILNENSTCIDAKAIDALVQPESQNVSHRASDLRVSPVEVRLLGEKGVIVKLFAIRRPFPRAAPKPT